MVGLGGGFAGFIETFASVVPAADVHHGDATLVMLVRGAGILLVRRLHALLGDFQMHARAIGEFLAGAFENFFKFLLGASEFLLIDRKSTRLNSSHSQISYAVFCLKKKNSLLYT